jgi:hypothetical protein
MQETGVHTTQMAVRLPHATARRRRTGSGAYRPAGDKPDDSQQDERLGPARGGGGGQGITNTINRAELAPIEYALREGMERT